MSEIAITPDVQSFIPPNRRLPFIDSLRETAGRALTTIQEGIDQIPHMAFDIYNRRNTVANNFDDGPGKKLSNKLGMSNLRMDAYFLPQQANAVVNLPIAAEVTPYLDERISTVAYLEASETDKIYPFGYVLLNGRGHLEKPIEPSPIDIHLLMEKPDRETLNLTQEVVLQEVGLHFPDKIGPVRFIDLQGNIIETQFQEETILIPEPGKYLDRNITEVIGILDEILLEVSKNNGIDINTEEIRDIVAESLRYIDTSFDIFESVDPAEKIEQQTGIVISDATKVFLVPPRCKDTREASHLIPALDLLDLTKEAQQKLFYKMLRLVPPVVLATYEDDEGKVDQIMICAPQPLEGLYAHDKGVFPEAQAGVNEALAFARRIFKQKENIVVGLGATLPLSTFRGKTIDPELGFRITTGHTGTVTLMIETIRKVMEADGFKVAKKGHHNETNTRTSKRSRIGVVGVGNIGESATRTFLNEYENTEVVIYDTNPGILKKLKDEFGDRIIIASGLKDVIAHTPYLLSAVVGTLSEDEQSALDLDGVVAVEDSQPYFWNMQQASEQGAIPLVPLADLTVINRKRVGIGYLEGGKIQYNFGSKLGQTEIGAGFDGDEIAFGCEFEVLDGEIVLSERGTTPADVKILADKYEGKELVHTGMMQAGGVRQGGRLLSTSEKRKRRYLAAMAENEAVAA